MTRPANAQDQGERRAAVSPDNLDCGRARMDSAAADVKGDFKGIPQYCGAGKRRQFDAGRAAAPERLGYHRVAMMMGNRGGAAAKVMVEGQLVDPKGTVVETSTTTSITSLGEAPPKRHCCSLSARKINLPASHRTVASCA